jgi:hypothetical protein
MMLRFEGTYRLRYQGGRENRRSEHHEMSVKVFILHYDTPQKILSCDSHNRRGLGSLTYGAEPFLRSRQLCSYSRTFQNFTVVSKYLNCVTFSKHRSLDW